MKKIAFLSENDEWQVWCVIRNMVSLVIGYRQYSSVAELIDIFSSSQRRGGNTD